MNNYTFESHNLETKNIPIIFHYDTVENHSLSCPNWHSNIEILHFTFGNGQVIIGNEAINVKAGGTAVINTNVLHSVISDKRLEYYCLIIDSDFLKYNGIYCDKTEFKSYVESEQLSNIFNAVVSEITTDKGFQEAGVKAELLRLMLSLSREYSTPVSTVSPSSTNESIRLAIGYIRSHIYDRISLDEIAAEVGLSKYHFSREFKKATGMTLINYINAIRCIHAKKLLLKNEYPIHEISLKCGFENDSYFSKTFKKHTGFLPSELAKEQNNVN